MHPLLYLIAASVLVCAACAGAIWVQMREQQSGIGAGLLLLGFAYWGTCQIFFHLQPDPDVAIQIARATAPGWMFLGPLCLKVFSEATESRPRWLPGVLFGMYGVGAFSVLLTISTPWVIAGVAPGSWGYGIVPGPLFLPISAFTLVGVVLGLRLGRRRNPNLSAGEARRLRWITVAALIPAAISGVTDVALPVLGVIAPTLAPASFLPLALLVLSLRVGSGYSTPLTPSRVATEILKTLPDGVVLLQGDGRIRLANRGMARLCGRSPASLRGVAIGDLLRRSEGEANRGELDSGSGSPVPVALTSNALQDPAGGELGRVLVVRDLREIADLRNQLITSGRLAAVGELAAGIAHEINNPLAFVRSNLSQLEELWKRVRTRGDGEAEALEDLNDGNELIEESIEGVDRAAEIVRGVKSFAHAGSGKRERVELAPLLDEVVRIASVQLRHRAVACDHGDEAASLVCTPQQLKQVFLNLVINAAQAVGEGGSVSVSTCREGDWLIVSVADDGCGIPRELIDRIFDPFFTTKAVGEGTGLGLGIAHQIVRSHGGEIEVESVPGEGSIFRVRLPARRGND